MRLSDACNSYFSGFKEIYHFKKNNNKTNALALLKIMSYFTLVIPSTFAVVYAIDSLCCRISKKHSFSKTDNKVNNQANKNRVPTRREETIFNAEIKQVKDINEIGHADFDIHTAELEGTVLKLEIDQQSLKDPEIQLFQDENKKLYLAGGKTDSPTWISKSSFSLAEHHSVKVHIDLSFLKNEETITIFKKTRKCVAYNGKEYVTVQEASERPLITIENFNNCKIHDKY